MKEQIRRILSVMLCAVILLGCFPIAGADEHLHIGDDHLHSETESDHEDHDDHDDHEKHEHAAVEFSLLNAGEAVLDLFISCIAIPAYADYEDGVECEYCGGWRYDDWKCDNGDHCGEGADGSCYEEHHCGYCGACDDDHEMCDDCGNCLEDHCECDEKCRGCYSTSGDVCDVCNEHCTECVDFICDDCGICADCAGNELYCSQCMLCIGCADWICYCGEGCSNCAEGCSECYEKCTSCAEDELCTDCGTCFTCVGGEGNYCPECMLCKFCTEYLCECGTGCSECVLICESCGEKCENCADGGICKDCGTCYDCVGGDGNYCINCDLCKFCVDYICVGCSEGCSECATICPECGEKCENCADDELCSDCGVCFTCRGGEGNYCEECGICKNCVDFVCHNGDGCSQCAYVCTECGEKCSNCAELELCIECGICFDCVGGEGSYCSECLLCKNCVEQVCYCGNGCSECSVICMDCGEKCENCADDQLCGECERCFDCAGGDYCAECGECIECVEYLCICGNGCNQCADICEECNEKCSNCALDELCSECGTCRDCVGGDDNFCNNCSICKFCVDYICVGCSEGCSNCADVICEECGEKCSNCSYDELCTECGVCRDCVGGEGNFCDNCSVCKMCVDYICICGEGCSYCATVCMECGEKCSNCSDSELCVECGKCVDCAGSDSFCTTCGLCSDCGIVCPCGEGCENCADLCPECGEKCSACCDEFCASCDICIECAEERYCENCGQCGDCTEICEDCGVVCADCAESVCEECGKCSGCIDSFCPDCGICEDCADTMCGDCHYCGECAENICVSCGEYCSDCAAICPECEKCEKCADICSDCGMCEECCAEAAEGFGCSHGICTESAEWIKHYCTVGEHCIDKKSKIEYNETMHWSVCGEGCDIRLYEDVHMFASGKVTKEATKKADGEMSYECLDCGYVKKESIPKLSGDHTHKYTVSVTAATCNSGGYTTHTCSCGHSYKDNETKASDHAYEYKYTADEHWQECKICHETTSKNAHKLSEWTTVKKAGYTENGEKQRICRGCGYTVSESIPKLAVPEDKFVVTIPDYSAVTTPPASSDGGKLPTVPGGSTTPAVPDGGKLPADTASPDTGKTDKPDVSVPVVITPEPTAKKELLTKGSEQTVPTLPTPPPTQDGNIFDSWVNKETGEQVKKGDKLTGNVELVPVWKDCGENNHNDGDNDNHCDKCGYIMVKSEVITPPVSVADTTQNTEEPSAPGEQPGEQPAEQPSEKSGIPTWLIVVIAVASAAVLSCVTVLIVVFSKNKKKSEKTAK